MNFADIRKKFSGGDRAASADPSRAFGSEAEMMQALRADGLGNADHSAIACYYEKLAKVEVTR